MIFKLFAQRISDERIAERSGAGIEMLRIDALMVGIVMRVVEGGLRSAEVRTRRGLSVVPVVAVAGDCSLGLVEE